MSYSIIVTRRFEKELKRLSRKFPSFKEEFAKLIVKISENPLLGTSIGNCCYKIRLAISSKGRGKSGGTRVITYVYIGAKTVYLLTIYDKSEKNDLKPNELKTMVDSLELDS
jgi:mRNA-degrading endonuclease RelE of RelBE toxin-antitoxin system